MNNISVMALLAGLLGKFLEPSKDGAGHCQDYSDYE
jgi:hypothetical protein